MGKKPNKGQMAMLALGAQAFDLTSDRIAALNKLALLAVERTAARVNGKTQNIMDPLNSIALEGHAMCITSCQTAQERSYMLLLLGMIMENQVLAKMDDRFDPA